VGLAVLPADRGSGSFICVNTPILDVVVLGAGPIGLGVVSSALSRPALRVSAVVDVDPSKIGQDAGKLLGVGPFGVDVVDRIPTSARAAVVCTSSSLERLEPTLHELFARKLPVVSTCEELVWPWRRQRERAVRIDAAARAAGVPVLGVGVNPGFVMDALPLFLTGVCHDVRHVTVERIQDASTRRQAFQDKVGVGLSPQAFAEGMATRKLGHVGLPESCEMIAMRLGWTLDDVEEEVRAVVAEREMFHQGKRIAPGVVIGVEQIARGMVDLEAKVELVFRAAFGQSDARDRIVIEGSPPLEVAIKGGVPGDVATTALVLNALSVLPSLAPGVRTMADVPALVSGVRAE
jgi:2,4-diaminopentanoate dehydrogenase